MQQIIYFFIKNKNFLLFAFLFLIALILTIQSHSYHNSKVISSTNFFSGGIYSARSNVTSYFDLRKENNLLIEENTRLREQLATLKSNIPNPKFEGDILPVFNFTGARVINNNYSKIKNQLTLDKGLKDSLEVDMGVITSKGLVGIINKVSDNYARVQSILNTTSQINAKLKKSNHIGFLTWNTKDPNIVQLIEIPKLAPIAVGDTIVTSGNSSIFPKGILIGTVKDFTVGATDSFTVDVQLFNDMTSLNHVYVIKNLNLLEIENLEKTDDAE
ncbi:rod shape-determining protein MreC [Patiriisocius marinistellae]|uniref:Cell shape-determining protein MreC n=1 Tax=Patiriisocius marinistellae TaxID=2494560 RepID=A0A5J4FW76_9FLAO|nr:rod shape-determining protein MreC [Patiriisocius marinistellae]GEQ85394.1 rod shape-determining protein MreC [Patiriisocius marinistellae]